MNLTFLSWMTRKTLIYVPYPVHNRTHHLNYVAINVYGAYISLRRHPTYETNKT